MSLECKSYLAILSDRAAMFKNVRLFFERRHVLEVDTPLLSKYPPIDAYIDILETSAEDTQPGYFHSSPEYGMKKLLASGIGDIYQLSHVFRKGEVGPKHQIEFTMLEWYRHGFSFEAMQKETQDLIFLFLGELPVQTFRYEEVFQNVFNLDPFVTSYSHLLNVCSSFGYCANPEDADRDALLHFLWDIAESRLEKNILTIVTHFPASQAALSNTFQEGSKFYAARFEIYYQGMELANGYHELTDAIEQQKRLNQQNEKRLALGKESLPVDVGFIESLNNLSDPHLYGVAVGFDRLMMLRHGEDSIEAILPLGWSSL